VSLRVKVDEHGSPVQATVLQSDDSRLNPVALDAVLRSNFAAARNSAGAVSSWITVTLKVEPER
jgi:outer membrane biosynthesis protein TonB